MSFCAKCGSKLVEGANFCPECGAAVGEPRASAGQLTYEIKHRPSYSLLVIKLSPGQSVVAEAGALTYMTPNVEVKTRRRERGLLKSISLKLLGGQSFFVNEYTARGGEGEIGLVAAPIGDITVLPVSPGNGYIIQKSAFIASSPSVNLDVEWQGFTKGIFGQGLFMIKVTGQGELFINTFGAIDEHSLGVGEKLIVDNYHLVAFSDSCRYKVSKFGGFKETLFSGEGLVTEITGPGKVLIQTKNLREFVDWLWTLMESRVRSTAR